MPTHLPGKSPDGWYKITYTYSPRNPWHHTAEWGVNYITPSQGCNCKGLCLYHSDLISSVNRNGELHGSMSLNHEKTGVSLRFIQLTCARTHTLNLYIDLT